MDSKGSGLGMVRMNRVGYESDIIVVEIAEKIWAERSGALSCGGDPVPEAVASVSLNAAGPPDPAQGPPHSSVKRLSIWQIQG